LGALCGHTLRIGLIVLSEVAWLALASACQAASPRQLPEPVAFVGLVESGELDAESYDFDRAGLFRLSAPLRAQWQAGAFSALAPAFQPGVSQCTLEIRRKGVALAWVQIATQSANAGEWRAKARTFRSRLAEMDLQVKRSVPDKRPADPVVRELLTRYARDQAVRNIFDSPWFAELSPQAANNWILVINTRMSAIDCDNTAWLKRQLVNIGWFTIPKYGEEADMAAWHLVQHADRELSFQSEMLGKLQALPPGSTNSRRLGYLFDRVAHAEGRPQRYGTQGTCKEGRWTPYESEDPDDLDRRRASLGMEPIADYMKTMPAGACPH
jgi:hypothetical protein